MEFFTDPVIIASFLSLTALEIVLGIDNIIFIALLVQHLPENQQKKARNIGIFLALFLRILMLFSIVWIIQLKEPFIELLGQPLSGKDLMMLAGGGFLIYKATSGIHEEITLELKENYSKFKGSLIATIFQIAVVDIVFSFDSIMTAVGITEQTYVIVFAMIISMIVMLVSSGKIAQFIKDYPTLKILALSFVMMIGLLLVADGFGFKVPKGYIYAAMGFSLLVEALNITRGKAKKTPN